MAKFKLNLAKQLPEVAGVVGGTVAANTLDSYVPESIDPRIVSVGKILGGLYLANNKNAIMKGAGYGMISAGGTSLYNEIAAGSAANGLGFSPSMNARNYAEGAVSGTKSVS